MISIDKICALRADSLKNSDEPNFTSSISSKTEPISTNFQSISLNPDVLICAPTASNLTNGTNETSTTPISLPPQQPSSSSTSSSPLPPPSQSHPPTPTHSQPQTPYYSFEFFPPKTEAGLDNLYERIDRMKGLEPLFIDVTWGSGGCSETETLSIARYAQQYCGLDVLMHLTCTNLTKPQILTCLTTAKSVGIHNILALRGDAPKGQNKWEPHPDGFNNAGELVKFIKQEFGDYFGIAVAGHPESHIDGCGVIEDIQYLKEKVTNGADFVITQFFYDVDVFIDYVKACRAAGITCPIIPGIMPIQSYGSFVRMTQFCKTKVSPHILSQLSEVKDDDEAVKTRGVTLAAEMCKTLLELGVCDGVHFYTLNLERSVKRILEQLDWLDDTNKSRRRLPWRPSTLKHRSKEEVRPINWANRPKSYMKRTEDWDEFHNGRWGDARSPAFGELSDSHFYRFTLGNAEDRKAMLGECPTSLSDVYEVFSDYIEGKIPLLPWCEVSLQPESFTIQKELAALNRAGFLTINSQPAVNGVASGDAVFGWGGAGGYVYQKAYVECFVSKSNLDTLIANANSRDSLKVYACNSRGEERHIGHKGGVTALTWGVFTNKEILQPTVFDPQSFIVWSEEAFSLWETMWMSLYDEDSESYELVRGIYDDFYLVAIVDNDYIAPSLWAVLLELGGGGK